MSAGRAPWWYGYLDAFEVEEGGLRSKRVQAALDYDPKGHIENPCILDADGNIVVGHDEYHVFGTENLDNIRLLLAAPELLQAATKVLAEFDKWKSDYKFDESDFIELRAAIAKATGEPS